MDDSALANAMFWLPWIEFVKFWAEVGVVVALGVGVIADRIGAPMTKRLENARELELAKLRNDAAEANRKAEEERLARIKIEERLAPRNLPPDQREVLIAALKRASIKGQVDVRCMLNDPETCRFASQFEETLKAAGWPTTGPDQMVWSEPFPLEISVLVHAQATAPPHGATLRKAFSEARIGVAGSASLSVPEGTVQLVIGHKPP